MIGEMDWKMDENRPRTVRELVVQAQESPQANAEVLGWSLWLALDLKRNASVRRVGSQPLDSNGGA